MTDGKDKGKRRRGAGEGTLFLRKDGYDCGQVDLGVDERTRKRSRPTKCFKLRKDAAAWLTRTLEEKRRGQIVLPSKGTVGHYAARWVEHDLAGHRPRVAYEYKRAIETNIVPHIGALRLDRLASGDVKGLYRALVQRGVSPWGVALVHKVLHRVLEDAVEEQAIYANPAKKVRPAKAREASRTLRSQEDVQRFLTGAAEYDDFPLWELAIFSGARLGELLGLTWRTVDFAACTISIAQTVSYVVGTGVQFGKPKTVKSRRTIAILPEVMESLKRQRARVAEAKLRRRPAWVDNDLVFPSLSSRPGQPRIPTEASKAFQKARKALELPPMRFHDARHLHATELFRRNAHPKTVQERLGHANVGISPRRNRVGARP